MSEATAIINVRVDAKKKREAAKILNDLGLTMSSAVNTFIAQIVETRGLPYEVRKPSHEMRSAMKEADAILAGRKKSKGYRDVDLMLEEIANGKKS